MPARRWFFVEHNGQTLLHRIGVFDTVCGIKQANDKIRRLPLPARRETSKRCGDCALILKVRRG